MYNHNGQLNKRGESLIQIEARQEQKRCYFSTHIYVLPSQFKNGLVINHPNAQHLNGVLSNIKSDIERIELDSIYYNNIYLTVSQLKEMYNAKCTPSALLIEFGREVIFNSDRKKSTQDGYEVLFNNLEKFRRDIRVNDIDYNFIVSYDKWLKDSGIMDNTRIGRLQQLKTIISEAHKREIIPVNPFNRFKIPTMTNKAGFLSSEEVSMIEQVNLSKKEKNVRDAFLFSCYTGLRYSDVVSLKSDDISDGWIKKKMIKTGKFVEIPIRELFDGKSEKIIEQYGKIEKLVSKLGQNGSANQILKKVFEKAGINPDGKTFHLSRHTCASLLMEQGIPMSTVQHILGHVKISTTAIYAEVTKKVILNDIKKIKK